MTPEQWTLVERLYHEATAVPAAERAAWLARECAGDDVIGREVESLLAQDASVPGALDGHAFAQAPGAVGSLVGQQIGGYEFLALIDEGGMGQVYRARDLKLPREVAIKVIAPAFSHDPVRRARFRREAEVLAALAHPHIAHIYAFVEDQGHSVLAMELVSGETLAARIRRGPLALGDVLRFGAEIADALAEAHTSGIVHRDLKPGNVMVTSRGVKVLDFGLARHETRPASVTVSAMAGTPGYMAPEQAADKGVDARADLFALGLVLYEMATGALPIPGASLGSMLAHNGSLTVPAPSRVRKGLPSTLDRLVSRLLSANPANRPASAAAVRDEMRGIAAGASSLDRRKWLVGAAAVVALALGSAAVWRFVGPRAPNHFEVAKLFPIAASPGDKRDPALSPDGASLAFSWKGPTDDKPGIYVVQVAGGDPRRLTETTASDVAPAWSPDGRRIAYQRVRPGMPNELMLVPAQGGPAQTIRTARAGPILGLVRK